MKHGDEVPANSIYRSLYEDGFVAVGTGVVLEPDYDLFLKFKEMLENNLISSDNLNNCVDLEGRFIDTSNVGLEETATLDNLIAKEAKEKMDMEWGEEPAIGFTRNYSMFDEQSGTPFFYFSPYFYPPLLSSPLLSYPLLFPKQKKKKRKKKEGLRKIGRL